MGRMKDIYTRLQLAGRASREAADHRAEAAKELDIAVRQAVEVGMSKTQVAEVAGINRVTVYEILNEEGK